MQWAKPLLALLTLFALANNAHAFTPVISDRFDKMVDIRAYAAPYNKQKVNSFMSVMVEVTNNGAPRELYMGLNGFAEYAKTIRLNRGETRSLFFSLPALYRLRYNNSVNLSVVDTKTRKNRSWDVRISNSSDYGSKVKVGQLGRLATSIRTSSDWRDAGKIDPVVLKTSWKALAGLELLLVERNTFERLSGGQKTNLRDWVLAGGVVYFLNTQQDEHDKLWQGLKAMSVVDDGAGVRMGFGVVRYMPSVPSRIRLDYSYARELSKIRHFEQVDQEDYSSFARSKLPDIGRVDATWVFIVLIVFAALAGPLGIVVLIRRRNKPFKYLGNMMLLSVVFSGGILLVDSFLAANNSLVSSDSVVLIDHQNDRQVSMTQTAVYPLTELSFELPHNAGVTVMPSVRSYRGERYNLAIDDQPNHQLISGLLPVRQRRAFLTQQVTKASGRLLVTEASEGGGITVENHLQRDLISLWVQYNGKIYDVGAMSSGESRQVTHTVSRRPDAPHYRDMLASANMTVKTYWRPELSSDVKKRYLAQTAELSDDLDVLNKSTKSLDEGQHWIVGLLP